MRVLDRLTAPIVQAPLAGGASTPELAAAVSGAGGLGFLAAGYRDAGAVAREMDAMGDADYGVNLFVPGDGPADPEAVHRYTERLRAEGHEPGTARHDDDGWDDKLALLAERPPAVVSFTFGCPDEAVVAALREAGSDVWVTVTGPEEARLAQWAGATALVAQGIEAGGHRGSFADRGDLGLLALLALLGGPGSPLPLVASGGIATAPAVAAVLAAGARAAQVGTAFMLCPEAGTPEPQRRALAEPGQTSVTRAFTGRPARGIENRFLREHPDAPAAYPELHHVTAPIRAAGRDRGDPEVLNLWAGQAHELARAVPAADVVAALAPAPDCAARPIGVVRSPLADRSQAPRQGDEGGPEAWLELDAAVAGAAADIRPGDRLVLLTWLHEADRETLRVHPRDDPQRPLTGVFSTRSPDRPNPIGLHEVTVTRVEAGRVLVADLEAIDGTPLLDIKPVLTRNR